VIQARACAASVSGGDCFSLVVGRMLVSTRGCECLKSKLINVRIRVATARQRRAASIAERIVRAQRDGRRLPARAVTRNVRLPRERQARE
jgi:hypothetical protein